MSTPILGPDFDALAAFDPDIASVVTDELERLRSGLQLIASENFTSPAVLAALGSTLSNKYAEGYPGRRYYGGCEVVDRAEEIGIARARSSSAPSTSTCSRTRVPARTSPRTPPSSSPATPCSAWPCRRRPPDARHQGVLLGQVVQRPVQYGVREDNEHIDYDQVRDLAREHRPKMIVCGGSAIPRLIDFAAFREIADEVGAILMVDAAHFIGLVAGKAIPSPVPYADVVTFTTHKVLRGPRGGAISARPSTPRPSTRPRSR